jgi:hypothetical protein
MTLHARQSRRQFIKGALKAGMLGLTTTSCSGPLEIRESSQLDADAVEKFRARLKGELVLPADRGYDTARRVYFLEPRHRETPGPGGAVRPRR